MGSAFIATSAAALLESVPFILAAALLSQLSFLRVSRLAPYLGCGCGTGPSARSLPAAVALALTFGPAAAALRFLAACIAGRTLRAPHRCADLPSVAGQIFALLPAAATAAFALPLMPALLGVRAPALLRAAEGMIAAFLISPCALGVVAIAGMSRTYGLAFAAGFLSVAGIADLRAMGVRGTSHGGEDGGAYALLAIACALVALRGGAQLVHPYIAYALAGCAPWCIRLAIKHRRSVCAKLRIAPALMLAGVFAASPPPAYHATETTLGDAFPGEPLTFTGLATQTGARTTLVRYAITCCRADASPVVVRLSKARPSLHGWVRARGTLNRSLELNVNSLQAIAPPPDPFIYR